MLREPIPVREAVNRVIANSKKLAHEIVAIDDAYGWVLAEAIVAKHDVPPFNRSAYDGYAIRAIDSKGASSGNKIAFKQIVEIGAGHVCEKPLGKKEAYRIMTGAILPENADAIVMLEHTLKIENGFTIEKSLSSNENISFRGEDAKEGEILIEAGTLIHPGTVALLATLDRKST